jgi:hypothetical protein
MFWSAGCSLLWPESFFSSLEILYEGLGIGKLCFLMKKNSIFLSEQNFFQPWIRIGSGWVFSLKCWMRIRIKWTRIRNTENTYTCHQNYWKKKRLDTHILLLVLVSLEHLEDDELCEALEALLQPLLPSNTHVNKLKLTASICNRYPLFSFRIQILLSTLEAIELTEISIFVSEQNFSLFLKNIYNIVSFRSFVICKDCSKCIVAKNWFFQFECPLSKE